MRWLLAALLGVLLIAATVEAQQPYCIFEFEKGSIWIDSFPLTIRNAGTGVAYGVQVQAAFLATAPGGTNPVLRTEPVKIIDRIGRGSQETLKLHRNQIGDTFSATAAACRAE